MASSSVRGWEVVSLFSCQQSQRGQIVPCDVAGFQRLNLDTARASSYGKQRRGSRRMPLVQAKQESSKRSISFGDQLLDYIEGGPKLRKWYGAPEQLPRDGGPEELDQEEKKEKEEPEEDGVKDAVLVTDADDETGQLVVLSLILRRYRVRVIVRDPKAATAAFGPYVEPIAGDVTNVASIDNALRGVRAVICPLRVGAVAERARAKGVDHIVLLSQVGVSSSDKGGLFGVLFGGGLKQASENEAAVVNAGVPHTIVRAGKLKDEPGGLGFSFAQGDTIRGSITREDAAEVCVRALESRPTEGLIFEVVNGESAVSDWVATFDSFVESSPSTL